MEPHSTEHTLIRTDLKYHKKISISKNYKSILIKKNAVFWDVALYRSCVNRRFGGTYRLSLQGRKIGERGTNVSRWLQPGRETDCSLPSNVEVKDDESPICLHGVVLNLLSTGTIYY
jgi:hypothetical protein